MKIDDIYWIIIKSTEINATVCRGFLKTAEGIFCKNGLKNRIKCSIISFSEKSDVKGKAENSVKAGRLCHSPRGGGCYEKIHI